MDDIGPPDSHYLNAALGWLELGNPNEAQREWDRLSHQYRGHPDVLEMSWRIAAAQKNWTSALQTSEKLLQVAPENPIAWINQSYALHELKRTQEAWDLLRPLAKKFPKLSIIPYNLACYACQLGNHSLAQECLELAMQIKGKEEIKEMALQDVDLEPMWSVIRAL